MVRTFISMSCLPPHATWWLKCAWTSKSRNSSHDKQVSDWYAVRAFLQTLELSCTVRDACQGMNSNVKLSTCTIVGDPRLKGVNLHDHDVDTLMLGSRQTGQLDLALRSWRQCLGLPRRVKSGGSSGLYRLLTLWCSGPTRTPQREDGIFTTLSVWVFESQKLLTAVISCCKHGKSRKISLKIFWKKC